MASSQSPLPAGSEVILASITSARRIYRVYPVGLWLGRWPCNYLTPAYSMSRHSVDFIIQTRKSNLRLMFWNANPQLGYDHYKIWFISMIRGSEFRNFACQDHLALTLILDLKVFKARGLRLDDFVQR